MFLFPDGIEFHQETEIRKAMTPPPFRMEITIPLNHVSTQLGVCQLNTVSPVSVPMRIFSG